MTRPDRQEPASEAAGPPVDADPAAPADALATLPAILTRLADVLDRQADAARPRIEPMALRIEDLEAAIGVDERTIGRWRSAGKFPKPDIAIGRTLLWRVETVRAWLEGGRRS